MTAAQLPTQRHHYVPEFYLRTWHQPGLDKLWLYMRNPRGEIEHRARHASSTGHVPNLYSVEPDGMDFLSATSQEIESGFFSPLDAAASGVHRKLLGGGVKSLTAEERKTWIVFINSLLERLPQNVAALTSVAKDVSREIVEELRRSHPGSQAVGTAVSMTDFPRAARNLALADVSRRIADEPFFNAAAAWPWLTVDAPAGPHHFLTGDRPVVTNLGVEGAPIWCLSMALSPRRWLALSHPDFWLDDAFAREGAAMHNAALVKQTIRYVMSSRILVDEAHIKYRRLVGMMLNPARR